MLGLSYLVAVLSLSAALAAPVAADAPAAAAAPAKANDNDHGKPHQQEATTAAVAAAVVAAATAAPPSSTAVPEAASAASLPAIPAGAGTPQAPIVPLPPLRFLTHFADHFPAGKTMTLVWTGGSGDGCELYYVPRWPGFTEYEFVTIVANTTAETYDWQVPPLDMYPEHTEFVLGIKNAEGTGPHWYDLTASLPLA